LLNYEYFSTWNRHFYFFDHVLGGVFTLLLAGFLLSSLLLYLGARLLRIEGASYLGAAGSTLISGFICLISNMMLSVVPILGNLVAFFGSFLLSAAVTSSIFGCSLAKGFAAEVLRWFLSAALVAALFVGSCAAIVNSFHKAMDYYNAPGEKTELRQAFTQARL